MALDIIAENVSIVSALETMPLFSEMFACSLIYMLMLLSSLWFLQSMLNLICQPFCQLSLEKEKRKWFKVKKLPNHEQFNLICLKGDLNSQKSAKIGS